MIDEEETPQEEPKDEAPQDETPQEEETSDISPQTSEEEPAEEPAAPAAEEAPKPQKPKKEKKDEPEVIPGADLEPDLVLEESGPDPALLSGDAAAQVEAAEESFEEAEQADQEEEPDRAVTTVLELAADARYQATGKRKHAVARVILKPGKGEYKVNGRDLAEFFPRPTLQKVARGPLEATGQTERLDVVAKIHGGGVSSQAGALRHGIAKALMEADPALRGELKRRGYLTRDPRVKERKKAGLKKARKRPQFSKR